MGASAEAVRCRVGSSEIGVVIRARRRAVRCRVGSSEMVLQGPAAEKAAKKHRGDLNPPMEPVPCRVGGQETKPITIRPPTIVCRRAHNHHAVMYRPCSASLACKFCCCYKLNTV